MGTRQRSQLPIKEPGKRLKSPSRKGKKKHSEVLQDLETLSSGRNPSKKQPFLAPHLRDPLTPLHRLRRFKEIRDRNLRRGGLRPKRLEAKKMSVDMEKNESVEGGNAKEIKAAKEKQEKITNGTQENGEKHPEENIVVEKKIAIVEENGEMNRAPENSPTEKGEVTTKVSVEYQIVENERETIVKEVNLNNEQVQNDEISEDEDVDVEILKVEDDENSGEPEYDSAADADQDDERVKVLRCSFRGEVSNSRGGDSPQPSTSKQYLIPPEIQTTSTEQSKDKRGTSLSPETIELYKSNSGRRVEGRRPLYQHKPTGYRKRKFDDEFDHNRSGSNKKQTFGAGGELISSPSVLSPGWKFISSPFTRFWTPHDTPKPGSTPYKSISLTTPYPDNDIEDSMAVNYDDKSIYCDLNDSELGLTVDSTQPTKATANHGGWRCSIM